MSTLNSYVFNNTGGIRSDMTDITQQNIQNTRFGNYSVSNYFSENVSSSHIDFATSQPGLLIRGEGVAPAVIDQESQLFNSENERHFEKLQLHQRPFITVPYLGRGGGDPTIESQLQQGEIVSDKKSVATVSEMPYINYDTYPMRDDLKSYISDPTNSVQELSMEGWVRGGTSARYNYKEETSKYHPNAKV